MAEKLQMPEIEEIKRLIVERLRPLEPEMVVLFSSYKFVKLDSSFSREILQKGIRLL